MKRLRATITSAAVLGTMLLAAPAAHAHVIPPEKLHPVAEAYRRATFVLNLNPVVWEQVEPDLAAVADYWRGVDPEAAAAWQAKVGGVIAAATRDADGDVEPIPRAEAARAVFTLMTQAIAQIGCQNLALSQDDLGSRDAVRPVVREARGVLGAFDDVICATDPPGYRNLGRSWLEMTSALGAPGLLGVGAVQLDRPRFEQAVAEITAYIQANFGADYQPLPEPRLAPFPARSPTFDPSADLPPKLPPGADINKQLPRPRQILNMARRGVDESETPLIALGDMAFDSPFIFGDPARSLGISCNTCHNKSITNPNFFVPGLSRRPGGVDVSNSYFAPHARNGHFDPLDIPDLRGIRFTGPYGRNGRFDSLREFVRNVIVNEFDGPEPDPLLLDGLLAYMFEFDFLDNPYLDRNGRLNEQSPTEARRGELIFHRPFAQMADMSCASCHVPSAHFIDHRRHDIGTVHGADAYSRDGALETPTLLGIKYTPPYFHDGSQPTLRSVTDWFNDRYVLDLTEQDRNDLTAYLEAIGDGTEAYEDTVFTLEAEMEEFIFFLSTYQSLRRKGKAGLIGLTFQTIALEIRAHKWDLQDWAHMPVLERLASLMDEAHAALQAANWERVDHIVREYRAAYEKHKAMLI